MKSRLLIIILTFLAGGAFTNIPAQTLNSSYFLEGATYRHQLNPAFMGDRNYISFPALGNINVGTTSTMGLTDFIYKFNDPTGKYDLTTFMNSAVDRNQFLGKLKTNNQINTNVGLTILSTGFYAFGGFNTFELNLKSNTSFNLPYELFNFMKTGMDQDVYHINNFAANSNNYVELALGHAHKVNDRLTIGAKLKFLAGIANVNGKIDSMDIALTGDKWEIMANGTLNTAVGGGHYKTKASNPGEINGFDVEGNAGAAGYGAGVDLGATYKLLDNLILSASALDLGFISWNNNQKGATHNKESFTFEGFNNIAVDPEEGDPNDVDTQFDNIKDDLKAMTKFYDEGKVSRTTMLATTINLGAEYKLPFYDKLSVGLLSTTHVNKPYTWTQAMLAANISPLRWLGASVNYSYSTFGSNLGWMLNFHPKGFTFFVGSDRMITSVTPQYVPMGNANANLCFGFNITFGRHRN
ncbi:DUF5723 family protein [uncultured Bacteroides sp.]|uniref:DUF5723 family protein n=1 Tax=uncultured Bacteroides sp. TaxID=162156 RepID=UPI002AAAD812|nr:DUF5723 family protein [uncultured Bacteroides sp.]